MRLVTYHTGTASHIGAVVGETLVDLSLLAPDMLTFIAGGPDMLARAQALVAANTSPRLPLASVTLLAPIPRPRKNIMCLGWNYAAHSAESARARGREATLPSYPVVFTKSVTAVNHPDAVIPYDANVSSEIDWEVELAFVIGRQGKNIQRTEALDYVFGYMILNDISARDIQSRHKQFFLGKSLDGSAPCGPWIVTPDEIGDPQALRLQLRVNGVTRQDANTSDMIFKIPDIIATLSLGITLEPGDIVATGTPSGVAMGMDPPVYLRPGDVVEAEIERIGVLRNTIGEPVTGDR
jgi:2-keto-4-pentenoate hydratase/2-oxohepta-3-ene-1,7-dioic acid hydratase (catechol pathway)